MTPTKILEFDAPAREKLLNGIAILAKAVGSTLGPKGRNVAIERQYGSPNVIHDGVTVAREIYLKDKFENMGVQIAREAASSTNDIAGDGTTTATILAYAIAKRAIEAINAGANPMVLREGIEKAVDYLVDGLKVMKIDVDSPEMIKQVATISAQNEEIGEIISQAITKVTKDGVVTVQVGDGRETVVEYKEGLQYEKGYTSAYFVTDTQRMEAVIEDAHILITDQIISSVEGQLVPILDKIDPQNSGIKNIVFIAESIEGDALKMLVVNKIRGNLSVVAVPAPGFGDRRKAMLEDIAIITGGTVISEDTGATLSGFEVHMMGRASSVIVTKDTTTIVGGMGDPKKVAERTESLKHQLENETSTFDKEKLQERISKLSSGVAVIHVGASTEIEMREKKERVIDAVNATRAAMDEGIVPGGETALFKIVKILDKKEFTEEEMLGVNIIKEALREPFFTLMENSGLDKDKYITDVTTLPWGMGVDVKDGKVKDLIKAGVIDPVKVTRSALQNASSVAIMTMTTNTLIAREEEPRRVDAE